MSKSQCLTKIQSLNELNHAIYDSISGLSHDQLSISIDGQWSILQVLEHVKQTEVLSLKYLQYKIAEGKAFPEANWKSERDIAFLKFRLWLPFKAKAPNKDGLSPKSEGLQLESIQAEWKATRAAYVDLFNEQENRFFDLAVYRLVGLGRVKAIHMLSFFNAHMNRHIKQINTRAKLVR